MIKNNNTPAILIKDLVKKFGDKVVLDGVNLEVAKGESFVVIGGSGTGKSVLIKCILGLLPFDSGKIYVNGQDLGELNSTQRQEALGKVGMLFQGGALFDSLTVAENIVFGLRQKQKLTKAEALKIAAEKLLQVDLDPKVGGIYPAELSGGMQKRVALARAIATDPEIIFFDEPTTGLDPIVSNTINNLIVRCVKKLGASAFTITHDIQSLRQIGDRVGLLHKGKIVWSGTVPEMDKTDNKMVYRFINGIAEPEGA